jgi:hypothetical protein
MSDLRYDSIHYTRHLQRSFHGMQGSVQVWSAPKGLQITSEQVKDVEEAWRTAQRHIQRALERLKLPLGGRARGPDIEAFAQKYLLCRLGTGEQREGVSDVLRKAGDGLAQPTILRVCDRIEVGADPWGAVERHVCAADAQGAMRGLEDDGTYYHNASDIHLQYAMLADYRHKSPWRLKVVTIIHEATHKFAGTFDYSYFDMHGDKPKKPFDDPKKAMANADGLAWFAYHVGRRDGFWRSLGTVNG